MEHEPTADAYGWMGGQLPNEVAIGGALITMVEPDVGYEHAYNRWYEDDHFYSGAMVGPWMFSGRRWVATSDLQAMRFPADSPIAQPVRAGCYISTYWTIAGHHDDAVHWGVIAMRDNLYLQGRGFDQRQHVYTAFSTYDFGVVRSDLPRLQPHLTLEHPMAAMVVEVIEPDADLDRAVLVARLRDDVVPAELEGSPCAAALAFMPEPLPPTNVPACKACPAQAETSPSCGSCRPIRAPAGRSSPRMPRPIRRSAAISCSPHRSCRPSPAPTPTSPSCGSDRGASRLPWLSGRHARERRRERSPFRR